MHDNSVIKIFGIIGLLFICFSIINFAQSAVRQLELISGQSIGSVNVPTPVEMSVVDTDSSEESSSSSYSTSRTYTSTYYRTPSPPSRHSLNLSNMRKRLLKRKIIIRKRRDELLKSKKSPPLDYTSRQKAVRARRDRLLEKKQKSIVIDPYKFKEPYDSDTVKMAKNIVNKMDVDLIKAKKIKTGWERSFKQQKRWLDASELSLNKATTSLISNIAIDLGLIYRDKLLKKLVSKFIKRMDNRKFSTVEEKKMWERFKKEFQAAKDGIPRLRDLFLSCLGKDGIEAVMKVLVEIGANKIIKKNVNKWVAAKKMTKQMGVKILKRANYALVTGNFSINRVLDIGLIVVASDERDKAKRYFEQSKLQLENLERYIGFIQTNKMLLEKCLSKDGNSSDICNCIDRIPGWWKFDAAYPQN